jgi:hypothetical protein
MRAEEVRIQDLYEGAYLICQGYLLKDLLIQGTNGRKVATFIITGAGVETADAEYQGGRATANVALLKFTMEKLKDRMFEKLREREEEERAYGAGSRGRGSTRQA